MTAPERGARVVRALAGRDWPGTVVGAPFPAVDGDRVRVRFDAGSAADVLTTDLRPEATDTPDPAQPLRNAPPSSTLI